ncbi:MAG: tryptophan--tRNA ligase [Parcubacteria group bacterium]|nr:tryptophan--tRNA ligase [Parcubacteria group bacterium]
MSERKRLFTGLQPSGALHIGNYFGTVKPFLLMYESYESFLCAVDYHALTTIKDPKELEKNTFNIVAAYLASGVDPEKAVIFKQSDVSEHTELAWILECQVTVPFLMQAHSYKDKTAQGIEPSAGLFNYPMLMASDILLYDAEVVPVGEDQRQHIEYTREAAGKFNNLYGETFKLPKEHISKDVGVVPGTDGRKMSKSYKNTIPLFGSKDEIASAVMSIVTDSTGERPENVFAIHKLFKPESELTALYKENKNKYKELKEALIEDIETVLTPMRERRDSITETEVKSVLETGGKVAKEIASKKMAEVREKIGAN